jgi:hypothetical protein
MRNPIRLFWLSVSDTHSYAYLANLSFGVAVKYTLTAYLLIALGYGGVITYSIAPPAIDFIRGVISDVITQSPDNLTLTIDDGKLTSSGISEPYSLPLTKPLHNLTHAVTVDTAAVAKTIKDTQSLILLTANNITIALDSRHTSIRILSWSDLDINTTITTTQITKEARNLQDTINTLEPWLFPLTTIGAFISLFWVRLVYILFHAFLLRLVQAIGAKRLPYVVVLKLCLYTLVITEVIWSVLLLLYKTPPGFLYSAAFYIVSLIAFGAIKPVIIVPFSRKP